MRGCGLKSQFGGRIFSVSLWRSLLLCMVVIILSLLGRDFGFIIFMINNL